MSYRSVVLSDYPLAYWPLDDLTTADAVTNFTDLLSQFNTYQEVLDNFDSYANIYGDIAYDHSGCNNHSNYIGDPNPNILPIVIGNSRATKITDINSIAYVVDKDYYGSSNAAKFGVSTNSNEPFSIEAWFYPKFDSATVTSIVGDLNEDIGLFYDDGNILFSVQSQKISYTIKDPDRTIHVVGVYGGNSITLYVDGKKVASKTFDEFLFTNSTLELKSGPTAMFDHFLINSVAIYRYQLSEAAVLNHYIEAQGIKPEDVVQKYNGEIFAISDTTPNVPFRYSYPGNKSWVYLTQDGLTYNEIEESLSVTKTDSSGFATYTIDEFIALPGSATMDSSKIEWTSTKYVSVYVSLDGVTYTECVNGGTIPNYTLASFNSAGGFFLRIELTSFDTSLYLPKIWDLTITFYNNQIVYSNNGSSYFSTLEGVFGAATFDATVGNKNTPILFRGGRNGIKTIQDSGFIINTSYGVGTLEFFYTPSSLNDNGLIAVASTNGYSAASIYWHNLGTISKSNISKIYVNGVDKTSETNVLDLFEAGEMYHVVIVFASDVSGQIKFGDSIYGSVPALFQNIALYENLYTQADVTENYDLYRFGSYTTVNENGANMSMQVVENSVNYYNNDWLVYQTQ